MAKIKNEIADKFLPIAESVFMETFGYAKNNAEAIKGLQFIADFLTEKIETAKKLEQLEQSRIQVPTEVATA